MVKLFVKLHVKWKEKTLNNETLCKTLQVSLRIIIAVVAFSAIVVLGQEKEKEQKNGKCIIFLQIICI